MAIINLSQNKTALIDDADYEIISQYKWHYNNGYAKTWHSGKRIRMHRLILDAQPGQQIDHISGDKLDNRRSNLRICTIKENNRNVSIRKDNTSGYKGVSLDKTTGHWRPSVYVDGKAKRFGLFKDKHHAALAYDLWCVDLHGEYASTNFKVISDSDSK